MFKLRKSGLRVSGKARLRASQTSQGKWVAWLEVQGEPVGSEGGKPKLFEGHTRYQAQCKAYRWYFPNSPSLVV